MTSGQKRPPPTHGTRAAIMSPGLNAAAQIWIVRPRNTTRFTGRRGLPTSDPVSASARFTGQRSCLLVIDRQGLPAVQVYGTAALSIGHRGLPAVEVYWPSRFTGRRGLPAVQVYRPATSSPGRQGLPAIEVYRPSRFTGRRSSPASDPIFRGNGYTSHPSGPSDLFYWDKGTVASKIHACEMHAYEIHISRDGRDSCE